MNTPTSELCAVLAIPTDDPKGYLNADISTASACH